MPLLEIQGCVRTFPGVRALDGVDFSLDAGEVHALVGENGAGKSTLIHLLSGTLEPEAGTIRLEGEPVRLTSPILARRLGIVTVHQEADLFASLSVAENMALTHGLPTGRLGRVRWDQVETRGREAVAVLGEPLDIHQEAGQLSIAQRHLAQVAAAIAQQAKVIILDEPTSSLTAAETDWLLQQVRRLRALGTGILYVSHRQDEIFSLSDRITVLRDGRRVWTRATKETNPQQLIQAMVGRETSTTLEPRFDPDRRFSPRFVVEHFSDAADRFRDASLEIGAGEIVGLYGLVGAGRSEWAQAIVGLAPKSSGMITLDGKPIPVRRYSDALAQGIAYLPEDRLRQGVCRNLSVRENAVLASLRRWCWGPWVKEGEVRRVVAEQATRLQVKMHADRQPIGTLSGGNQQKVVLGRCLLARPRVLILDEPTRGVDVQAKAEIHRLIRQLADEGMAVLLISSELPEVLEQSDRVLVLRSGRVTGAFRGPEATPVAVATAALPAEATFHEAPTVSESDPGRKSGRSLARKVRMALHRPELRLLLANLVLFLLLAATSPRFLSAERGLALLVDTSVWAVLALGAAGIIVAGGIDISLGSLVGLSAAAAGLVLQSNLPTAVAVPLGLAAGMLVGMAGGLLNAGLALLGRIHPVVVTLGTLTIFRGLVILLTGGRVLDGISEPARDLVLGQFLGVPGILWIVAGILAAMGYFWAHTVPGRHLFALGSSPSAARHVGISKPKVWLTAFAIGGLAAGCAGLFELLLNGSMQSGLGTGYELRAIAAAVIGGTAITGGRGSVAGVVLGAFLLTLLQNALVAWEVSRYRYELVLGSLMLAAILLDRALREREVGL